MLKVVLGVFIKVYWLFFIFFWEGFMCSSYLKDWILVEIIVDYFWLDMVGIGVDYFVVWELIG